MGYQKYPAEASAFLMYSQKADMPPASVSEKTDHSMSHSIRNRIPLEDCRTIA